MYLWLVDHRSAIAFMQSDSPDTDSSDDKSSSSSNHNQALDKGIQQQRQHLTG
jgi:hypothetical protein